MSILNTQGIKERRLAVRPFLPAPRLAHPADESCCAVPWRSSRCVLCENALSLILRKSQGPSDLIYGPI